MKYKLGKKAKRTDKRTLQLGHYLLPSLPPNPPAVDWTTKVLVPWGSMGNEAVGDCTCAAAGHLIMAWTANAGPESTPADSDILTAYEQVSGYIPSDPGTDQGAVELDVLNYWRNNGIADHKITAFVEIGLTDLESVQTAIALFGGCYIGVRFPSSAMNDFDAGNPWTNTSDENIEGGHALPLVAYDADTLTCITWGKPQKMSNEWFRTYADEAYAILTPDWIEVAGLSPSGFDLEALQQDLNALKGSAGS